MDAIDAKAHVSAHGGHTAPVMESENLPLEAWPRDKILSMIQECQEVPDPIILTSGAYYYPRGIYQLFETQDGARIGIWAEDPDDLALGDFIVTEEWSKKLRENGVQIPPGTVYKGNYLRDLGNGNLSRLRVFTARETYLGDKWFASETAKHNEAYLAYQEEQGRLIHDGGKRWLANGVVYQLVDNEAWLEAADPNPTIWSSPPPPVPAGRWVMTSIIFLRA